MALAIAPSATGPILVVPIAPGSADGLAALIVGRGGRLLGAGPFKGSLIVEGDRDVLVAGLWRHGIVALSGAVKCEGAPWR